MEPVSLLFSLICSYVVDSADKESFETSRKELHELVNKPQLGTPCAELDSNSEE